MLNRTVTRTAAIVQYGFETRTSIGHTHLILNGDPYRTHSLSCSYQSLNLSPLHSLPINSGPFMLKKNVIRVTPHSDSSATDEKVNVIQFLTPSDLVSLAGGGGG